jgi:uncharacterized protein
MTGRRRSAERVAGTFDAFGVARRGAAIAGRLDAAALPRVADRLGEGDASIAYRITGAADALGRPAIEVSVEGAVPLECQRCLRTFSWPVAQRTLLLLARDEPDLARLDEDDVHEVILAATPQDPVALVEDELLLSLPFAPHCDREDCEARTAAMAAPAGESATRTSASAFDALASMKAGLPKKPKRRGPTTEQD